MDVSDVFTPQQIGQLLAAEACRICQAPLLSWVDIDHNGRVSVPGTMTKTGRSRALTLPSQALQLLHVWQHHCTTSERDWLFLGHPLHQPLSTNADQLAIKRLAEHLGLEGVSSHSCRRSALTAAHKAGLDLRALADTPRPSELDQPSALPRRRRRSGPYREGPLPAVLRLPAAQPGLINAANRRPNETGRSLTTTAGPYLNSLTAPAAARFT
jgi:integrase